MCDNIDTVGKIYIATNKIGDIFYRKERWGSSINDYSVRRTSAVMDMNRYWDYNREYILGILREPKLLIVSEHGSEVINNLYFHWL